jgi:hypothetical protein
MNEKFIPLNKLQILKISHIYGSFLSILIVSIYLFTIIFVSQTIRYIQIQAFLLPLGVVSPAVFSYLHLSYIDKTSKEIECLLLPGFIVSVLCIVPGLIITYFGLKFFSNGEFPVLVLIILIGGVLSLVLGTLSLNIILKGKRTLPEGLEQWKVKGLQVSTIILITGLVVAGISIASGIVGYTEMSYKIMLKTPEDTTFFIPVPIDGSDGNVTYIVDKIELVEGTANWKIVDTEYGEALQVNTSGKCVLSAKKGYGKKSIEEGDEWLRNNNLTMLNGTKHDQRYGDIYEVWVFSSNENTTMLFSLSLIDGWNHILNYNTVSYTFDDYYTLEIYTSEIPLHKGWQIVNLDREMMLYD